MRCFASALLVLCLVLGGTSGAMADVFGEARAPIPDSRNTANETYEGPHVREIMNEKDWANVVAESKKSPVFLFKHSTQCEVSAGAAYRTNTFLKSARKGTPKFYFVKVIERRPVSQKIEKDVQLKHESPQLMLIKDGHDVWNTSHEAITEKSIQAAIDQHAKAAGKKSDGNDSK